jgi:cytochrome c oxidase assembly protein subunit 15
MRGLTTCALLLALVVTTASAWLRLAQDGRVCGAQDARCALATVRTPTPGPAETGVRLVHRIVASADALLVIALAWLAWKHSRRYPRLPRAAFAALAALIFLATLGALARGSRLPAVTLGNLVGGWVLIVFLARLRALCAARASAPAGPQRWAFVGIGLLVLQLLAGGVASAEFAGVDCGLGPGCREAWTQASLPGQLDPWTVAIASDGRAIASPAAQTLLWAHRVMGFVVGGYLVALALRWRAASPFLRPGANALLALLALQFALGSSAATLGLPLPAAVLHNLDAALLVLVLAGTTVRIRAAAPGPGR